MDSKLVRIYYRGQLIKTHERQPKGERSTDVADYPPKVAPYTTRAPDGLKCEAAKLGPAVGEFAERLFEGDHPWSKIRQGHKLLRLGDRYTTQRLDAACQRALDEVRIMPSCIACGAELEPPVRAPHTVYVKTLYRISGQDYCRHHVIRAAVAAGVIAEVKPGAGPVLTAPRRASATEGARSFQG